MKYRIKIMHLALIFVSTIVLISLLTSCWGDPGTWIRVNNLTDQTLVIFIDELQEADIPPGELEFSTTGIWPEPNPPWGTEDYQYLIEAKTKKGEVVYSEEFTWQELDDMDWIIVIPSLQNK